MIVVDAGPLLELLLGTATGHRAAAVLGDGKAAAPDLVDVEVFHGLVRSYRAGRLDAAELEERVQLLVDLDIVRVPARDLLPTARDCVAAVSSYDAVYVALARILDCPLLTTDRRLASTASRQLGVALTVLPPSPRSGAG